MIGSRAGRALLAVVLATALVAGVLLVDPLRGPPAAPALDESAPPGAVAAAALEQAPARDHVVVTRLVGPAAAPPNRSAALAEYQVDADDRQLRAVSRRYDDPYVTLENEHVTWQGWAGDLQFRGAGPGWRAAASRFDHVDRLRAARNVTRTGNESVVVVHVDDADAAYTLVEGRENVTDRLRAREEDYRANLTVVVDRETDAPRRVVYRFANSPDGNASRRRHTVLVYDYDWHDVDVRRPPGAGYTLVEFASDLLNHRP
ncbi:MAG: hypothetical protein ABEJ23_05980 [Haloarculaceae archaeon]